jgi:hypothetical protein
MTTSNSGVLLKYFTTHSFVQITDTTSIIAVALLVAILIEREILRMSHPEAARRNVVTFATVVIPMTLVFTAVILARFVRLS